MSGIGVDSLIMSHAQSITFVTETRFEESAFRSVLPLSGPPSHPRTEQRRGRD
jgi:hypothetical protein